MKMLAMMCAYIVAVMAVFYAGFYFASKLFWTIVLRIRQARSKPKSGVDKAVDSRCIMPDGRKVDGVYRMRFEMAKEARER
jgi:hypothetical protein